jgi:GT2 family glycosyltransferase
MKFSLIVCTYMRPKPLLSLLNSVKQQTLYPNEILIVDGSTNTETEAALKQNYFDKLIYFKVNEKERGLTKQRNFGIDKVAENIDVVCFLDDDIVLTPNYFETLISTYSTNQDALAVGGYIINDTKWEKIFGSKNPNHFYFDSWQRKEPYRFKIRKVFGLEPDTIPGFLPTFAHGRPLEFLPPSGKIYEVEQLMGGASSYRKMIFDRLSFSTYFIGYGLYEDTDFALRLAKEGKLYVNTKAQLYHHHENSGRPNQFNYGKMVVRNGWYIWRVKYPNPNIRARIKWNATALLLSLVRIINIFNTNDKITAFSEGMGRITGWFSLLFNKPKIQE